MGKEQTIMGNWLLKWDNIEKQGWEAINNLLKFRIRLLDIKMTNKFTYSTRVRGIINQAEKKNRNMAYWKSHRIKNTATTKNLFIYLMIEENIWIISFLLGFLLLVTFSCACTGNIKLLVPRTSGK